MYLSIKVMPDKKEAPYALTPAQIDQYFIPLIPKPKRGSESSIPVHFIFTCIQHKLKTGCQWQFLFIQSEHITYPCSWQLVYYFFHRWSQLGLFEQAYADLLADQLRGPDPAVSISELNLDGSHSAAKKGGAPWPTRAAKKRVPATC